MDFILFILLIIGNRFTTLDQQNAQTCTLDIYITLSHLILLRVSVRMRPAADNQTK